jgi:hypothetical protein
MNAQEPPQLRVMPAEFCGAGALWVSRINRELMRGNEIYALFGHAAGGESPVERDEDLLVDDPNRSPLHTVMGVGHTWMVGIEEFMDFDRDTWLTSLTEVADSMANQLAKGMLEHIGKVSDDHGMTVSAEGRDNREAFLDALEAMEFSFDENGNHNLTLLAHPDTVEAMREQPFTDEQEQRYETIMARKKEAWSAARRRRELP